MLPPRAVIVRIGIKFWVSYQQWPTWCASCWNQRIVQLWLKVSSIAHSWPSCYPHNPGCSIWYSVPYCRWRSLHPSSFGVSFWLPLPVWFGWWSTTLLVGWTIHVSFPWRLMLSYPVYESRDPARGPTLVPGWCFVFERSRSMWSRWTWLMFVPHHPTSWIWMHLVHREHQLATGRAVQRTTCSSWRCWRRWVGSRSSITHQCIDSTLELVACCSTSLFHLAPPWWWLALHPATRTPRRSSSPAGSSNTKHQPTAPNSRSAVRHSPPHPLCRSFWIDMPWSPADSVSVHYRYSTLKWWGCCGSWR